MADTCTYELRSINLSSLPNDEALSVLTRFQTFLNSLSEPITFYIISDVREVDIGGALYTMPYKRFFIVSETPIDDLVGILGAKFLRTPDVPRVSISRVNGRSLVANDNDFIRTYTVSQLLGSIEIGFLSELYDTTHEIRLDITPYDVLDAKNIAHKRSLSVGSRIIMRQAGGRSIDPEDQVMYQRTMGTAQAIAAGRERLFSVIVSVTIKAKSYDDLIMAGKQLRRQMSGRAGSLDSPKYLQYPLYQHTGPNWSLGRSFYMPTSSLLTFFPFAGLDLTDREGIMIGKNTNTLNAVIYDIFDKENYNVAIMGQTGYGKSTFIKTFFSRLARKYQDMIMFVFDSIVKPEYAVGPDGSYDNSFAGLIGAKVHRYKLDEGAGLDPFNVFRKGDSQESPPDTRKAADFLGSLAHIEDDPDLLADLYITSETCNSVEELIAKSPERLKRRLEASLKPFMFLFDGDFDVYDKMVFVLNDIPNAQIRDAAAFLTLAAVWQVIKSQPVARKKAIVIDEGWSLVEINPRTGKPYFQLAVEYVPEIARTGRHYNTCFAIATQLVSDFLGRGGQIGPGREMIESCATKFVLKQDQAAVEAIEQAFRVSNAEKQLILNQQIGFGLLMTPEGHVPFYNFLSDWERGIFTTRPKDVTN